MIKADKITLIIAILLIISIFSCKRRVINSFDTDYDVVIVGGGISGLVSAFMLKDLRVLVLEKEDIVGGRIISGEWEGISYAKGMEYIGPPDPELTSLLLRLGLKAVQLTPPTDAISFGGNIYYGPDILNFLGSDEAKNNYLELLNDLEILSDEVDYAVWNTQEDLINFANLDGKSVSEWLQSKSYLSLLQQFINVENRGLFGANNSELSILFSVTEMYYNLPDPELVSESDVYSFPGGISDLVNILADSLSGKIITNSAVTRINLNDNLTTKVSYLDEGIEKLVSSKCVIISTPASIASSLAAEAFSDDVLETLNSINYSSYITVNLFTSERLWKNTWSISCVDDFFVTIYDAVRPSKPDTYTDKSVLGIFIAPFEANDNSILTIPDEGIIESIYSGLEKYFPDIRSKVLGYDMHKFEYAFPVFGKNYHNIIKTLTEDATTFGPIFLAGDYMVYPTFNGAFISAINAVNKVNEYLDK